MTAIYIIDKSLSNDSTMLELFKKVVQVVKRFSQENISDVNLRHIIKYDNSDSSMFKTKNFLVLVGQCKNTKKQLDITENVDYMHFVDVMTFSSQDSMKAMLMRIYKFCMGDKQTPYVNKVVVDDANIDSVIDYIKNICKVAKQELIPVSFDTETFNTTKRDALDIYDPNFKISLLGICFEPTTAIIIPCSHFGSMLSDANTKKILDFVHKNVFMNKNMIKIGHNIKFDIKVIRKVLDFRVFGRIVDSQLMCHSLDTNRKVGLKPLVDSMIPEFADYEDILKIAITKIKEKVYPLGGEWANQPIKNLSEYLAIDCTSSMMLYVDSTIKLRKDKQLYLMYRNFKMALCRFFAQHEEHGVPVCEETLQKGIEYCESVIEPLKYKILDLPEVKNFLTYTIKDTIKRIKDSNNSEKSKEALIAKAQTREVNLDSWHDVQKILYGSYGLGLSGIKNKDGKYFGTDESILDQLVQENDGKEILFIDLLKKYRGLKKTFNTYIKSLESRVHNGRIHPSYNITGTITSRLSCSDPNMTNMTAYKRISDPEEREAARYVKAVYIAPDGYEFKSLDLSQAEIRFCGMFSDDERIKLAYASGIDIHALTAATSLGMSVEDFYKKYDKAEISNHRYKAKAKVFGFMYDTSEYGYMHYAFNTFKMKISIETAKAERADFFNTYKGFEYYYYSMAEYALEHGYVKNLLGGRTTIDTKIKPDAKVKRIYHPSDKTKKSLVLPITAYRNAINSPVQGSSAMCALFALVMFWYKTGYNAKCFFNHVHDANTIIELEGSDKLSKKLHYYMENIFQFLDNYFIIEKCGLFEDFIEIKSDLTVGKSYADV